MDYIQNQQMKLLSIIVNFIISVQQQYILLLVHQQGVLLTVFLQITVNLFIQQLGIYILRIIYFQTLV